MKKQSLRCIFIGSLFCLSACGAQAAPTRESETKVSVQNAEQNKDVQENKELQQLKTAMAKKAQLKSEEAQLKNDEALLKQQEEQFARQYEILAQINRNPRTGRQSWVATMPARYTMNIQQANSVLLIPNKPTDAKVIGQLSEDMQVMSIILEEVANVYTFAAQGGLGGGMGGGGMGGSGGGMGGSGGGMGGYGGGGGALFNFNKHSLPPVEAIWLDGHGMIFTLAVGFPLVSNNGTEEKEQEAAEEKRDEVWQRSKNRLMGLDETNEKKGKQPPVFDPDKVKRLQKSLTEAIKHAANIRDLAPKDKVIVAARSLIEGDNPYLIDPFTAEKASVSVPTSVMTLQVEKQDVDAFSSGKIDLNAFTKKVTVVIY